MNRGTKTAQGTSKMSHKKEVERGKKVTRKRYKSVLGWLALRLLCMCVCWRHVGQGVRREGTNRCISKRQALQSPAIWCMHMGGERERERERLNPYPKNWLGCFLEAITTAVMARAQMSAFLTRLPSNCSAGMNSRVCVCMYVCMYVCEF